MFWINLKRILSSGWINFKRNGLVSSASVLVTTVTLSVVTALFLFHTVLSNTLASLQDKVDVSVYFTVDTPEDRIIALQESLEKMPEVATVTYTSADNQVTEFRDRHANDYLTVQALDEIGDNPFGGMLRITAKDVTRYESIANILEGDGQLARDNALIIERINYSQNKEVIDRLNRLVTDARQLGLIITTILAAVSVIIMYTTVRLTIYMSREEIGIMRLVGASTGYIRAPFLVEGMLYGFFAWLLTQVLFFGLTYFITTHATDILGIDMFAYYGSHFMSVAMVVLVIGIGLGVLSSALAVRKYLKV